MKFSLFIITFVGFIYAQALNSFPLWGSSWVIAQGNNKRIFSSILPLKTKQTCFNRI